MPAWTPPTDAELAADRGEVRDLTIVGAGPVGLSAAFWASMREAPCRIVDSLAHLGGQLTTLYPDKWIYDVPGHPRVLAKDLVALLREQALEQFDVPVHLETNAQRISWEDDPDQPWRRLVVLHTDRGALRSRALIVAGGHGAFEPKRLPGVDLTRWERHGVHYLVTDKAAFAGKRVVVVGGGDSACDWALDLLDTAERVTLVHRREGFRAHEATVGRLMSAVGEGRVDVRVPFQVKEVHGDGQVGEIVLWNGRDERDVVEVPCDALLLQLGFKASLGPLADWGFETKGSAVVVDRLMATGLEAVWACGDVATFDGKLKLIATGFAEAAIAVAQAVHHVRPEVAIQPKYSSTAGVPTQPAGPAA